MRTPKISGYFDVKVYRKGVAHEDRQMKAETDAITFGATFAADACPEELRPYAKAYTSQKDGQQRLRVDFKINDRCTWWQMQDGKAAQVAKPTNAELDGTRYVCMIDCKYIAPDPSDRLKACGLWANAVLFEPAQAANPFGDVTEYMPDAVPAPSAPAPAQAPRVEPPLPPLAANTTEDPDCLPF